MAEIYMYIPNECVKDVLSCGLKLSEWSNLKYINNDDEINCIMAYLNPNDCSQSNEEGKTGIKIEVDNRKLFIGEGDFIEDSTNEVFRNDEFVRSIKRINEYKFGMFRTPICLLATTVIGEEIAVINENIDSPLLYESSKEIYLENIYNVLKEENSTFTEECLMLWFEKQVKLGIMERVEIKRKGIKIYKGNKGKKYIINNEE